MILISQRKITDIKSSHSNLLERSQSFFKDPLMEGQIAAQVYK